MERIAAGQRHPSSDGAAPGGATKGNDAHWGGVGSAVEEGDGSTTISMAHDASSCFFNLIINVHVFLRMAIVLSIEATASLQHGEER